MVDQKGFTLVEILVTVVIVGILGGIVLSVIDPELQRLRAQETVLRANVEKMCYALFACGSARTSALDCSNWDSIGITPVDTAATIENDTYTIVASDPTADATVTITGSLVEPGGDICQFRCAQDFSDASVMNLTEAVGLSFGCVIE